VSSVIGSLGGKSCVLCALSARRELAVLCAKCVMVEMSGESAHGLELD
jgi:hypothetical protein